MGRLAVASASLTLGSFCRCYGISLLGSSRWSLFVKLEPVFTSLFSLRLLLEILKLGQYMGIAVVIGSDALYQNSELRRIKRHD
jgi:drug/metabolite transporter (DMT)-like permease